MTNPNSLYNGINERLFYTLGKRPDSASLHDFYMALSYAVRDQMMNYWLSMEAPTDKEVAYLSAEFLIGPAPGATASTGASTSTLWLLLLRV